MPCDARRDNVGTRRSSIMSTTKYFGAAPLRGALRLLLLLAGLLAVTACGTAPEPNGGGAPIALDPGLRPNSVPLNGTSDGSASELARIQAWIDSRYAAMDVRNSFVTQVGQKLDCIDWDAQPSVRALRARGVSLTGPVQPASMSSLFPTLAKGGLNSLDSVVGGQLDANGNPA